MRAVDELADDHDLFLVRLAAWFHDAVYAIPAGQLPNEEASARLALRELSRAGFEQEDLTQVARLVRLTATHTPGSRDPEGELLCDADLEILAAAPGEYAAYTAAIREEYAAVPEAAFVAGRLEIMSPLIEGDIFRTTKGRALTEAARVNVTAECAELRERLEQLVAGSLRDGGTELSPVQCSGRVASASLVEVGGCLPDLSAFVRRQQRRRHGRHPGHHQQAGLSRSARCRRRLALADLYLADGRQRVRHQQLSRTWTRSSAAWMILTS